MRWLVRIMRGRWLPNPPIRVPDPPTDDAPPTKGFEAINAYRVRNGLRPLLYMRCLSLQAEDHSFDMQRRGGLTHIGFEHRLSACDFSEGSENVAAGQSDWAEAAADWMTSAGHRRNMLGDWDVIGVGKAGAYYTAIFARR